MTEFVSPHAGLPHIPDDLTIPQFMLDSWHPTRPIKQGLLNPWLIEDATGRPVGCEELKVTKSSILIAHSTSLAIAEKAAHGSGIPLARIIIIDTPPTTAIAINSYHTLDELVREGLGKFPTFTERRLEPGEAKTKIALLNFSSGTTGRPKAVAIPHYALIANVVQMAFFCKAAVDYTSKEQQRYRPGLVAIAGMTETCTTVTFPRIDQKIGTLGSGGQLLPGDVARVMKPDGSLAGFNEPGELVVKGPSVSLCYLNNPEATKETYIYFDSKPDRWIRTGDEVMINEEAELFVLDRIKEIMKVRGFQVAPAELEGLLLDHPDVDDACVVGIPDEYSGEVPLAFIVPSPKALGRMKTDPGEVEKVKSTLTKYVADNKVNYKRLAGGIEFVDSIPKNPSGKLLRRFLRDKAKEMMKAKQAKAKL
ncbi:hypothetical protein PHLCEN_2v8309 [Hermanssonia centrifuga]|uniref:Uncharacterized protein n=1 Tax=Hermanssonia centrifuga TaxID=98765 RepID=A0A2R6NU62_9APHY|nr:hypothetical protein PHLCEN_2v8309 [Hermanssonia centrifuga]